MLMPSIFNNNLFDDDWFGFPFYGYADKAENSRSFLLLNMGIFFGTFYIPVCGAASRK